MAGRITNDKLMEALTNLAVDIEAIKKTIEPLPEMYKDIYIGNGHPPMRKTCRDYEEEKRCKETAKTEALKEKKDDHKWFNRAVIGALIANTTGVLFMIFK